MSPISIPKVVFEFSLNVDGQELTSLTVNGEKFALMTAVASAGLAVLLYVYQNSGKPQEPVPPETRK